MAREDQSQSPLQKVTRHAPLLSPAAMAAGALASNPAAGRRLAWEDGQLGQLLHSPDYNLFPNSAVFESDFVQVTKKGKWVDFTNMPTLVSVGVTSSDPCLPLPNMLLMARRKVLDKGFTAGSSETPERPMVELSRLLPLRYVRLSVHHAAQRILRLQTVTRQVYYLQLHQNYPKAVFRLWSRLADILKRGLSTTPQDPAVRIRHSLVPSGSSPSGSSSGEPFSDLGSPRRRAADQQGRKAPSGDFSQPFSDKAARPGPKRVSFQQLPAKHGARVQGDVSAFHRSIQGLLHNAPLLPVCTRCERRLPQCRGDPQSTKQHRGVRRLQQQALTSPEPTFWLQPLSRLWRSTLEVAGRK